jgi:hypothetical protein
MALYCNYDTEFFSETKQKAKKQYVCCECGSPIFAGEPYWISTGKWEGVIDTFKQHPWCRAACTHFREFQGDCLPFGALMEAWGEYAIDLRSKAVRQKYPKLRRYMAKVLIEQRRRERKIAS